MFARLDFSTFLVCCSGDLSDDEIEEKPSVAIYGGSICILTGLLAQLQNNPERQVEPNMRISNIMHSLRSIIFKRSGNLCNI